MTPTTDPPLDAPLTAEQIAAMQEIHASMVENGDVYFFIPRLFASHAALRDRLARAEARCEALEGTLPVRYELVKENNDNADWDEGDFPPPRREWWMLYRYETVTKEQRDFGTMYFSEDAAQAALASLRAAPTDGAARAGDAARDGGGAPE